MQAIKNILAVIFNWIHLGVPNYGVDIVLFTLLIKLVLLPFNILQTKSTIKTQMVQPKLKIIQDKYKSDPKKLQQAQMELYKTEGVNPLGGCLPLIIQMPILFSIFYVFRDYNYNNAGFLWVANLAQKDPLYILPVISGLSTYVSTLMLTPKTTGDQSNPMSSKTTNLIMSAFFLYISLNIQAGLVIYWIVNNVLQLIMQYVLNKTLTKNDETAVKKY